MLDGNLLLYGVLALILIAEFVNGWTDSPNAIATVVSTRVLSPYQAVIMATVLNAIGAMSGTAVAATIGKDIVRPDVINLTTVAAAMLGIIIWSTLAWYWGLPTSESHALIAGLTRRLVQRLEARAQSPAICSAYGCCGSGSRGASTPARHRQKASSASGHGQPISTASSNTRSVAATIPC